MYNKTHYNLYCLNPNCGISIYRQTKPLHMELNLTNFINEHHCADCKSKLVSLMDMEITEAAAAAGVRLSLQIMPVRLN